VPNMVLKHVGGAARHCIVCTFFCVFSFLSQVLTRRGLVTAVSSRKSSQHTLPTGMTTCRMQTIFAPLTGHKLYPQDIITNGLPIESDYSIAARNIYDVLSPFDNQDSEDDDIWSPKEPSQETLPTSTHHSPTTPQRLSNSNTLDRRANRARMQVSSQCSIRAATSTKMDAPNHICSWRRWI
jgi:hypothetical protein